MSDRRLTWEQIQNLYPDQWVGLMDVEFIDDNKSTIKSVIVKYFDKTDDELDEISCSEKLYVKYTTPDNIAFFGLTEG